MLGMNASVELVLLKSLALCTSLLLEKLNGRLYVWISSYRPCWCQTALVKHTLSFGEMLTYQFNWLMFFLSCHLFVFDHYFLFGGGGGGGDCSYSQILQFEPNESLFYCCEALP